MTDWDADLEEIVTLHAQPEVFSDEEIRKVIIGFLVHVPNHVAAAKKLIGLGRLKTSSKSEYLRKTKNKRDGHN
jgi:hypothetical protein